MYPGAVFLTSYEAGKGQRFYLYGSTAGYTELIAYYRTLLKQRGTAVFDSPATHIFEVGKYDENAMAFPPSVTIKDYAWPQETADISTRSPGSLPSASPPSSKSCRFKRRTRVALQCGPASGHCQIHSKGFAT